MPFQSLSTRIALPAGFFALVSVGLLSFVMVRVQREQMLGEVVRGSESIAETILLSLDHDMRVNRRDGVKELIEAVGRHAGIEGIRVFNKDGRISFSSRAAEVGRTVSTSSEACVQCHAGGARPAAELDPERRSRIYTGAGGERLLGTIHVIRNREGCQGSGCHVSAREQRILGVLDVTMSLEPAEERLAASTRDALLISLAAALFITAVLFLIIRQGIRKPINRMVAATRRVAAGDASLPVPRGAAREIGILATSVNEMIVELAHSRQRVEEWATSLEEKVAAKAEQLREAEFQVIQAEKLASVGLVAAGIAHELNSPLMAILTFAHLVKSTLPPESQAQEDVRMIEREANRCAAIIRQLLDYSRKQAQDPETHPCAIAPLVAGALELLKIELQNSGVAVEVSLPMSLPEIEANEVQLMQVLVNLMLNAVQAMPEGGQLSVRAEVVSQRAYVRELPPGAGATLVKIVVRDSGTGIARENLATLQV